MEQERRRIKRATVSDETRHGRRRAAVNPNAQKVDKTGHEGIDQADRQRVDKSGREYERRAIRRDDERGGASR